MKLRLIDASRYLTLAATTVKLPVIVEGKISDYSKDFYTVPAAELQRVGFIFAEGLDYPFALGEHVEIVEGEIKKELVGFKIKDLHTTPVRWLMGWRKGYTDSKQEAYVYPKDFLVNGHPHSHLKGYSVLVPVYK